jgi:hypothetical protein
MEAFYKEQRDPLRSPRLSRKAVLYSFQGLMGMGAIAFWGVSYTSFADPTGWVDTATGEPMSATAGYVMASIFGAAGTLFAFVTALAPRLPISVNGAMPDEDRPTGLAWTMSAAGLNNPAWADAVIPWSAFDRAEEERDADGAACWTFYFTGKDAVARYLGTHDAKAWNAGVGYVLEIAQTTASMKKTRTALETLCARLVAERDT